MSANQNFPNALFDFGNCYISGIGVTKDEKKGIQLTLAAAERELPDAHNRIGEAYESGKYGCEVNIPLSIKYYQKAIEYDFPGSQINLGKCYSSGKGVPKDIAMAAHYYTLAAKQDDPQFSGTAYLLLGECYFNGEGVKQDYAVAINCFSKAFTMSQAYVFQKSTAESAVIYLALCNHFGLGTRKNTEEAKQFF